MTIINTNIGSVNASAALNATQRSLEVAMERLSTGKRINSASDDAAGLSLSDRMTTNIRGLNMSIRNAADAQAMLDTSEGAQEEVTAILQRMRELSVQSSSDTNTTADRLALQSEIDQLRSEIDRIATTTTWGGQNLLDGTFLNKTFQVGAVSGQTIQVTVDDTQSAALGQHKVDSFGQVQGVTDNASDKAVINFDVIGYKGAAEAAFSAGASAKTIAAEVNDDTSLTGVTAKAATHAKISIDATPAGAVTFNIYGGGSTGAINTTIVTETDLTNLMDAINGVAGTTGVTAKFDGTSKDTLIVTDADGDDISFENFSDTGTATNLVVQAMNFDGTSTVGSAVNVVSAATGANDAVISGTVRFSSTKEFTITDQEDGSGDQNDATGYFHDGTTAAAGASSALNAVSAINIGTRAGASDALDVLEVAIDKVSASRGDLGAISNRLGSTIKNLSNIVANSEASRSRILDSDFAQETTKLARFQILAQAATAMLAQANASKQSVLALLQS